MRNKKPSSVILTLEAQKIKDRIAGAFSLKGIFSAGMIWFSQLDMDTMIDIVSAAKNNEPLLKIVQKTAKREEHYKKALKGLFKRLQEVVRIEDLGQGVTAIEIIEDFLKTAQKYDVLSILKEHCIDKNKYEKMYNRIAAEDEKRPDDDSQNQLRGAIGIIRKYSLQSGIDIEILDDDDKKALNKLQKLLKPKAEDPLTDKLDAMKAIIDTFKPADRAPVLKALNDFEEFVKKNIDKKDISQSVHKYPS